MATTGSAPAFQPNLWIFQISGHKHEALLAYASEGRPWPHARSLEALEYLASWRGAQMGVESAEKVLPLRNLV